MTAPSENRPLPGPGHLSVAFGLWMVIGSVGIAVGCAWNDVWAGVWLPLPVTIFGSILLLEAWLVPEPAKVTQARLPIWLHLLLHIPLSAIGFFGGAITAAMTFTAVMWLIQPRTWAPDGDSLNTFAGVCLVICGAAVFFTGAIQGLSQSERLWHRYVPARCPKCQGSSYCRPGSPYTYYCTICGNVHKTILHMRGAGH